MRNKFKLIILSAAAIVGLFLTGCYSDQFEPEPIIIDPVDTISFSEEILPRLVSGCAQSICHGAGAEPPDLTASRAYNSLVSGGYVDTADPLNSELYFWLIGEGGRDIMPTSGRDEKLIELVLGWMQQGALNN